MNLYVMRHGDAIPIGGRIAEDALRPLSTAGQTQVRKVAAGLKRRATAIDAVVSSPLIRAKETAALLAQVMGVSHVESSDRLSPNGSPAALAALLADYRRSANGAQGLLLVGHHPDVTVWTSFLANLDPSVCPLFGTAAIAALRLHRDNAEFLWYQTSEQLSE